MKEVVSNWIKFWEAVEDVPIRSPQRLLNEQIHLERCDATVILTLQQGRQCHCWKLLSWGGNTSSEGPTMRNQPRRDNVEGSNPIIMV